MFIKMCLQGADGLLAGANVLSRPAEEFGNDVSTVNVVLHLSLLFVPATLLALNKKSSSALKVNVVHVSVRFEFCLALL
jgi:hypothetical protein